MNKLLLSIEKRVRFALSSILLGFIMFISTFFFFDKAWIFIPVLIIASYFLTYVSLLEGIENVEWYMLFFMPVITVVSLYLFYFLFPVRWLTRIPFMIFFTISIYSSLLTANIFNVGVEKNLQLYRAAFSINYFYQTIVVFLLSNVLLSFKLGFIFNGVFVFSMAAILAIQLLWTIQLKLTLQRDVLLYGIFIGLIMGECAVIMSFIPFNISVFALFLTTLYYSLTGLTYAYLDQRLFKETIRGYIIVLVVIFILSLLSLSW